MSPNGFSGTARRTKSFPRNHMKKHPSIGRVFLHAIAGNDLRLCSPGYETGERSSLGLEPERRRWRKKGGRQWAAVEKCKDQRKPAAFFGHRNPGRSHNPEVVGSNPSPATTKKTVFDKKMVFFLTFRRKKFWTSFAEG